MKKTSINKTTAKSPSFLLHTCCADCASKFLSSGEFDERNLTLYFDNSNIHPRSEYLARLEAVKQISKSHNIDLIVADWSPKKWYKAIQYNSENTNLRRCKLCWAFRLQNTANKCHELGISQFSTTLLTSKYQNRNEIQLIGDKQSTDDLKFVILKVDSKDTLPTKGFYKQNYCGCVYSLMERYREKFVQVKSYTPS